MLHEQVKKCLTEAMSWVLATTDGEAPNVITNVFHELGEDDTLIFYQVFMNKTVDNVKAGRPVAVLCNPKGTMEGYQLKGTATYTTDEAYLARGNAMASAKGLTVKGAILVKADTAIVLTPGPDNGKIL